MTLSLWITRSSIHNVARWILFYIFVAVNFTHEFVTSNIHLFLCFLIRKNTGSILMKCIYNPVLFILRNFWFVARNVIADRIIKI